MKKLIIAVCIIALLINIAIFAGYRLMSGGDGLEEIDPSDNNGGGDDDFEPLTVDPGDFHVIVPEYRINDRLKYEYHMRAELYNENETGWDRYIITGDGVLSLLVPPVTTAEDGFKKTHECLKIQEVTTLSFTILVESDDSEPFSIHGESMADNEEFRELASREAVKHLTEGQVEMDRLPRSPIPITYSGKLRAYPDPTEYTECNLDEAVFLQCQNLTLNDTGSHQTEGVVDLLDQTYSWTVDDAANVRGYDTLRVNVSSRIWYDQMDFNKLIWLSNDAPQPVKAWMRSNMTWDDERGQGHMELVMDRTLLNGSDGYTPGSQAIPWKTAQPDFYDRDPAGEFASWEHMPPDGGRFDDTQVVSRPSEAVEYALENSRGLKDFLAEFPPEDTVLNWAIYNYTRSPKDLADPDGKAGTYYWNLTFGVKHYNEDAEKMVDYYWSSPHRYTVVVEERVEWNVLTGRTRSLSIPPALETGTRNGRAPYRRSDLADEGLTLSSAIDVMKRDDEVRQNGFNSQGRLEEDTTFRVDMAGFETSQHPELSIINTLTGITPPTSQYSWLLQKDNVWESGSTYAVAVDVQTGMMLMVLEISGTEMNRIFG